MLPAMNFGYRGGWVWLALLGLVGCGGAREVGLVAVIEQGRANELSATANYQGQRLSIEGVVTSAGLKRVTVAVAEGTIQPNFFFAGDTTSATISHVQVAYPYLYAEDAAHGAAGGRLLCFFQPDQLAQVGRVRAAERVVVTGKFQQYSDVGATIVLNDCKLE